MQENWKTIEREGDGDNNCDWFARYVQQRIHSGIGGFGNKRTSANHLNYNIVEIGQNTEKSPGDLRNLLSLRHSGKLSSNADVKNFQRSEIIIRIKRKVSERKNKYLDLARELKKKMEHEGDNYTNCNWCVWNSN